MNPQTVDIVIPVYNAYEHLRHCLESIRNCTEGAYRLILIDDASTDKRIQVLFKELRKRGDSNTLLFRNESNKGFVFTANRGMALSKNDIVLLNSDTVVTQNWLFKLKRCAASDRSIGTITPFSNNAEICSFPQFCQENPVPEDLELVNSAMEQAAESIYIDLPTGVGFCMYIRRTLIDKVGLFDENAFGKGYGEENDLCMRAAQAGFRNVLCSDTYVAHVGGGSFGQEKSVIADQQMAALLCKHPSYLERVSRFIEHDPLKPIRQAIQTQLQLLSLASRPGILHIMHGHGGGTETYIRNLSSLTYEQFRHYVLVALEREWIVKVLNPGGDVQNYAFQHQDDEIWAEFLERICSWLDIRLCHVHQLSGCRSGLLAAFRKINIPYGFSVHDFFLACPSINLLDSKGDYCNAVTDITQCQKCLGEQPAFSAIDIEKWRQQHKEFLSQASFISAPSAWAKDTFRKYFPAVPVTLIPNVHRLEVSETLGGELRCFLLPKDEVKSIGVIGAIGPVKGARNLEQLVEKTRERKLPIRWVVIGYTDHQYEPYQSKDRILTIHGPYAQGDLVALLNHYNISLVVFPSVGPETFCYTLSEAWAAGRLALVPPLGALEERVEQTGAGWIMDDWQDMDKILEQIIKLVSSQDEKPLLEKHRQVKQGWSRANPYQSDNVVSIYQRFLASKSLSKEKGMTPLRVYRAASQGTNINHEQKTILHKMVARALRYGVRFRYTFFGRWAERTLPARWHYRLRRLLLQS